MTPLRALTAISTLKMAVEVGIGARRQRGDHAHRPGDVVELALRVVAHDADRRRGADRVPQHFRREQVLERLVFGHAVAGLLGGHASQSLRRRSRRLDHRRADAIHLGLGRGEKVALGVTRGDGQVTGLLDGKQVFVHWVHQNLFVGESVEHGLTELTDKMLTSVHSCRDHSLDPCSMPRYVKT
jgi:hypothetical protein